MDLAALFWFYKEPALCRNRLELLKKHNPKSKIYGLYGGKFDEEQLFREKLGDLLDDFYTTPTEDINWKWIHGDLALLDWYENRGRELTWDSVAIVQWDTLVFDDIGNQLPGIKKGQIYLSGYKALDKETEARWDWTKPGEKERENYLTFLEYVKNNYGYSEPPVCCLFIFEVLPRGFLEKYLTVKDKELGMLEYKVPIYAKIFNIPIYEKDLGVYWFGNWKEYAMNAMPYELEKEYIERELAKPDGWRIFHPYFKKWDFE